MYNFDSPMTFQCGTWVGKKKKCLAGWYNSMLPELLEACHPFIDVFFVEPPDKMTFHFRVPTLDQLHDFVSLHGVGSPPCPNDFTIQGLTRYIYDNVVTKIRIGVPSDKLAHIPCGFSALHTSKAQCIHAGAASDLSKCVYVLTKSHDPIWSPRCTMCLGRPNAIDFGNALRMPPTSKRGTRHVVSKKNRDAAFVTPSIDMCIQVYHETASKGTYKCFGTGLQSIAWYSRLQHAKGHLRRLFAGPRGSSHGGMQQCRRKKGLDANEPQRFVCILMFYYALCFRTWC